MKYTYMWQARVLPAVALMLPAFVEINALLGLLAVEIVLSSVIANIVMTLLIIVVANLCRYYGKKKEIFLFEKWGGAPTTRFLRHSNKEYNQYNREMVKSYWGRMVHDIPIPSEKQEQDDPEQADLAYIAFVNRLRADARSSKMFPLLQAENRNYGMWRNLYGIKKYSIFLCGFFMLCNIALMIFVPSFMSLQTCCIISAFLFLIALLWIFVVGESRVKQTAESYAERLFETCYVNRDQIKEGLGDTK